MRRKKTLKELTLKDNFMFGAVMSDEKNCHRLLELVLRFPIERVEISKEKSIIFHPEYKGVRLDVYAKDENNTHYNIEMQVIKDEALFRRARYYHSQIDMEMLLSGADYSELPNSYVIFICDFDPLDGAKYCYHVKNRCTEMPDAEICDGSNTIFLSTRGKNTSEVPKEIIKFLEYVRADLEESTKDFEDDYVKTLQESVASIKRNREMEDRYMLLEIMLKDERKEGKVEACVEVVLDLLEELGTVPEDLCEKIKAEKDLNTLKGWNRLAAKVESIEQFIEAM